jgi:type IV pilus assembly protein PilY1
VVVTTADGPRALLRLSDKTTQSVAIHESANTAAKFRRVYMRPLN